MSTAIGPLSLRTSMPYMTHERGAVRRDLPGNTSREASGISKQFTKQWKECFEKKCWLSSDWIVLSLPHHSLLHPPAACSASSFRRLLQVYLLPQSLLSHPSSVLTTYTSFATNASLCFSSLGHSLLSFPFWKCSFLFLSWAFSWTFWCDFSTASEVRLCS